MLDKSPIGRELSCLSSISCSDLDQLPRGEIESRSESEIRKEGNRNVPNHPPAEGKMKERQGEEKGKKEIRKAGDNRTVHPAPGGGRKKDKGKREEGKTGTDQNRTVPNQPPGRGMKERRKERTNMRERKGKKESRKHGHRTEQNQPPPGGERLKERKRKRGKQERREQSRTVPSFLCRARVS